jgi:hypothetical protein
VLADLGEWIVEESVDRERDAVVVFAERKLT